MSTDHLEARQLGLPRAGQKDNVLMGDKSTGRMTLDENDSESQRGVGQVKRDDVALLDPTSWEAP